MAKPIPFLLCGKIPSHIQAVTNIVKPDFEVARVASSFEDAKSTISELANSSENVSFVVMGGGFPNEEFEALREMTNVPWLRPVFRAPDYKQPLPTEPPTADEIASRVRKALDERVDDIKEGNNAEAVWYF